MLHHPSTASRPDHSPWLRAARPSSLMLPLAVLLTLCPSPAKAVPPVYTQLPWVIAEADAVAVTTIRKIEPFVREEHIMPSVWLPDATFTLSVDEVLRGNLPPQIIVDLGGRQGMAPVGSQAMVFVKHAGPEGPRPVKGHAYVFEPGDGFLPIGSLVPGGAAADNAQALAAIREAVKQYRPPTTRPSSWPPDLNDEALRPFVALADTGSRPLKRWAVERMLSEVRITPPVGQALLNALDQRDDPVLAAMTTRPLMRQHYPPAAPSLRQYLPRLAADQPSLPLQYQRLRDEIRRYLAVQPISQRLASLDDKSMAIVAASLAGVDSEWNPVIIQLRLNAKGELTVDQPAPGLTPQALSALSQHLRAADFSTLEVLPLQPRVHLWLNQGKPTFKVE